MAFDRLTHLTHPKADIFKTKYAHRNDWMKAWGEMDFVLKNLVQKKIWKSKNGDKESEREKLMGPKTEKQDNKSLPSTRTRRQFQSVMERLAPNINSNLAEKGTVKVSLRTSNEFEKGRKASTSNHSDKKYKRERLIRMEAKKRDKKPSPTMNRSSPRLMERIAQYVLPALNTTTNITRYQTAKISLDVFVKRRSSRIQQQNKTIKWIETIWMSIYQ